MFRRSFLLLGSAALVTAPTPWPTALAQSAGQSEADRIAAALTPRKRRGGGIDIQDQKSLEVVERLKGVRQKRGLSHREQDELHVATATMPQTDLEIIFAFNSAEIDSNALPTLNSLGEALNRDDLKANTIVIGGHTDRKGSAAFNQSLSDRRAQAVASYLTSTHMIDAGRILASGYGFRKLKLPKQPFAEANRRVQIVHAAK